jgi:stage V sporulation protein S
MTEVNAEQDNKDVPNDDTLLLIRGNLKTREETTEYVKKVASAVCSVVQKHDVANLRCVGAASLNNAVKAIAIAKGEFAKKGVDIAAIPSFHTVKFNEEEKTAMVLEVIPLND